MLVPGFNAVGFRAQLDRDDDRGEDRETGRDQERQAVAVHQGAAVASGGRGGGGGEDREADRGAGLLAGGEQRPASPWSLAWTPLVIATDAVGSASPTPAAVSTRPGSTAAG